MTKTYPGMTVEVSSLTVGCSNSLFDGIFATGGITLSQVSIMTGLETYLIQNWVKRGFVSSPQRRLYSREQLARIVIINMLRDSLQIEKICEMIRLLDSETATDTKPGIRDEELYHRYVNLLADTSINVSERQSVLEATKRSCEDLSSATTRRQLSNTLQIMLYAHTAAKMRGTAELLLGSLQ